MLRGTFTPINNTLAFHPTSCSSTGVLSYVKCCVLAFIIIFLSFVLLNSQDCTTLSFARVIHHLLCHFTTSQYPFFSIVDLCVVLLANFTIAVTSQSLTLFYCVPAATSHCPIRCCILWNLDSWDLAVILLPTSFLLSLSFFFSSVDYAYVRCLLQLHWTLACLLHVISGLSKREGCPYEASSYSHSPK